MTTTEPVELDAPRPRLPVVDDVAPPERLAALRIIAGVFTLGYLLIRLPVFVDLTHRSGADFDGVGLLAWLDDTLPDGVVYGLIAVAIGGGVGFIGGWRYRISALAFVVGMLGLTTFRSSWGQLLHFENLMVLHLIVLAASPAADTWSLDARRASASADVDCSTGRPGMALRPSVRYGWPIGLVGLVTVVTYVIAGVAKLRYGGLEWVTGDTLQNHVAYSVARLDLIGGSPPVLGEFAVRQAAILPAFAALAVVVELAAPVVYLGHRWRNVWVASAWLMHVGIFLTMSVGFPSPLFGVAFAPFFALERVPAALQRRFARA